MSYEFMRHFADTWGLLFMTLVFLSVVVWALRPGASYRDHAEIPFKHDDKKDQRHG